MHKQALVIFWMLMYCALAHADGGIYKWVDDRGNVHYRDLPPPQGSLYQTLQKPAAPSRDPEAVMQELREKVEALDKANTETRQQEDNADTEAQRAQNCEQAKKNIEILETSSAPIRIDADGKRIVLDLQQRQEEVEKNLKYIEDLCSAEKQTSTRTPVRSPLQQADTAD